MDNRYYKYGCPPLMSDGRYLAHYVDSDVMNQYIRNINKIQTSHDYRMFLQKNGAKIMNRERQYLLKNNTCNVGNGKPVGRCNDCKCIPVHRYNKKYN
jgi:hypothetical protein